MSTVDNAIVAMDNLTNRVDEFFDSEREQLDLTKDQVIQDSNNKMAEVDGRADQASQRVDDYVASARGEQAHFRLTKNQVLDPNGAGTFPANWLGGFVKSARLVDTVSTGVPTGDRSSVAREFLQAINSDKQHFAGHFRIWELECYPNRRGDNANVYAFIFYQYARVFGRTTVAAIVKHISGVVPDGLWCAGLQAGQPAKVCGTHIGVNRNSYTHIHPYIRGEGLPETETSIIQVALPAAVSGHVDFSEGKWGQFPYLGDDEKVFN